MADAVVRVFQLNLENMELPSKPGGTVPTTHEFTRTVPIILSIRDGVASSGRQSPNVF